MPSAWEKSVKRWLAADLIDAATAQRIRAFEARQGETQRLRWPILLALGLGGLLLGAGVLLFVAAHWDELSPAARFTLVLLLVAIFHVGGAAAAEHFPQLSTMLHAVGTACLGAGIFLAAQIFNLEEHWPSGILLWGIGALLGWLLLRDWVQPTLAALLIPAWLAGEWSLAREGYGGGEQILAEGLLLLGFTYLSARTSGRDSTFRRAMTVIGWIAIIPCTFFVLFSSQAYRELWGSYFGIPLPYIPFGVRFFGWIIAVGGPLLLAYAWRGRAVWTNMAATAWVLVLGTMHVRADEAGESLTSYTWNQLGPYVWCAAGAIGLIAWGIYEKRKERINLGVLGFAVTVLCFYYANVMDKLGRSASLIGLGLIFLVGGWSLEKTRRRLVARLKETPE